jgi:glutathione S-transferase
MGRFPLRLDTVWALLHGRGGFTQFDPVYMRLNPKAVVPTLVHDGHTIVESTVICEYLDEVFPQPPHRRNTGSR